MHTTPLLLLILSACPLGKVIEDGQGCIDVAEDTTECPDGAEVDPADAFVPMDCDDNTVESLSGAGTLQDWPSQLMDSDIDLVCCYEAQVLDPDPNSDCMVGRPFGTQAELVAEGEASPRGRAWAQAALGEHASVAAFGRLALELMAHGAPLDLLRAVFAAADDELRHAETCFRLAATFGCEARAGALEIPAFQATRPLAAIAADAVREGCLVETLGAAVAAVAAELAPEPAVRAALTALAEDEARHAALSWRVVAWARQVGGPEVRAAVRDAFRTPLPRPDVGPLALRAGVDESLLSAALDGARDSVIRPAARVLLAA